MSAQDLNKPSAHDTLYVAFTVPPIDLRGSVPYGAHFRTCGSGPRSNGRFSFHRGDVPALPPGTQTTIDAPEQVEVLPVARDDQIAERLKKILIATGWFDGPHVEVEEGVVFLSGRTSSEQYKKWAGDLGRNTRDVVAVVNQLEVTQPSLWDFQPVWTGIHDLYRSATYWFPYLCVGRCHLVRHLRRGAIDHA